MRQCKYCGTTENLRYHTRKGEKIIHNLCIPCFNKHRKGFRPILSEKDFLLKVKSFNKNIEVISEFKGLKKNVIVKCNTCGNIFTTKANNVYRGTDCPLCARKTICNNIEKETKQTLQDKIKSKFPFIKPLEEYISARSKLKFKCTRCGNEFYSSYSALNYRQSGCRKCGSIQVMPLDKVLPILKKFHPYISFNLDLYIGVSQKYEFYCSMCKGTFITTASNLILNRSSCPSCHKSSGERIVESFLKELKVSYIPQYVFNDCKNEKPLRFDFYLPDYNAVVEVNGKQHYKPVELFGGVDNFNKVVKRDRIKKDFCKKNNISFIEMAYDHIGNNKQLIKFKEILTNKLTELDLQMSENE